MGNIPKFLIETLNNQYDKTTVEKILEGFTAKRKVTLRVNNIKSNIKHVKDKFDEIGVKYESANFYENALIIDNANEQDIQALDLYKNGEIYLQSLSSMLPPIALNPQINTDILDMCAAPGGKTTQIAAITNNKAHITACEMNHIRLERLKYNIEKQGATCIYTMQTDARNIDDFFSFDSILLDAPCSGSGTLNIHDINLERTFTQKLIQKSTSSQLALLRKAIKILKPEKEMIYSTCSILACENEDIINTVLKEQNIEIVPIELRGIGELPLLPTKIKGCICVCPNELFEGFFITKIRKKY